LESELFEVLRQRVADQNQRIKKTAALIAEIDVLAGLAETGDLNGYTCPEVNDRDVITIVDGRHPVIEQVVREEAFVPMTYTSIRRSNNSYHHRTQHGGKSTILRQTALRS